MTKTNDLSGKRILITGAATGLGYHFSHILAAAGGHLILAARRLSKLKTVRDELQAKGFSCECTSLDLADMASINSLAPLLKDIDVVVNNAGVSRPGTALKITEEDWDTVFDTNLKGLYFLSQKAAIAMKAHGRGGSIINIASINGIRQSIGTLTYHVSKAGVIQLTKGLALELARYNIRVNAIAPGSFPTEINGAFWESPQGQDVIDRIPQKRLGSLKNLEGPLLLLASDASAYMTGSVLVVDGGHLVSGL